MAQYLIVALGSLPSSADVRAALPPALKDRFSCRRLDRIKGELVLEIDASPAPSANLLQLWLSAYDPEPEALVLPWFE
jgi:hypothetical protein